MIESDLAQLEKQALKAGLILRIKINRPFSLWAMRLVVAEYREPNQVQILGEMKAWAYRGVNGLQLDTMRVHPEASSCVGHLVWAACMAWALESTPCRKARLLAIRDDVRQHACLQRYFLRRGFQTIREVGASPMDFPLRTVWGGAGSLMVGDCFEVYRRSYRLWQATF